MAIGWIFLEHFYYTADALKSLYRRQYRTRTLKITYTEDKTLSSSKELTSWVKLRLALQKISTCSLTHDVSSLEDNNIKCNYQRTYIVAQYNH